MKKHNLKRVLRLTEARTFTVRAIRAWRDLLPDWTPSLDGMADLDTMPHEHVAAVRVVAEGWEASDPRWDVLMALLEWERRQERMKLKIREEMESARREANSKRLVIPVRVVETASERTVETPISASFLDRVTTVRSLHEKRNSG